MKKLFLILILVFTCILNVEAIDITTAQCKYEDSSKNKIIEVTYENRGSMENTVAVESFIYKEKVTNNRDNSAYKVIKKYANDGNLDFYKNFSTATSDTIEYSTVGTIDYYKQKDEYEEIKNDNGTKVCPSKFYIVNNDDYEFYACGNSYYLTDRKFISGNVKDFCPSIKDMLKNMYGDGSISELNRTAFFASTGDSLDKSDNNVQEQYNTIRKELNELEQEYDEKCSDAEAQNTEECKELKEKIENLKTSLEYGEEQGIEYDIQDWELETQYNKDFIVTNNCSSYLGDVGDSNAPAYYLSFGFKLLKYAAIILLLVLSLIEFIKAVASSNQDAIKKASVNSLKRLIIAVVIFFLPVIIELLLEVFGVMTDMNECIGVD